MTELAIKECVPCRGGVPPLEGEEITKLQSELKGWEVVNEHHLPVVVRHHDRGHILYLLVRSLLAPSGVRLTR